jgi:hypothetical protein
LIKIFLFIAVLSVNLTAQSKMLLLFDEGISYETETLTYLARVEADGGEIIDIDAVNDFYIDAKANNYLDTLICALLYTGGVKKSNDSVFVWYDLTASENDFVDEVGGGTGGYAPFWDATIGIGGNTQPQLEATLTYNQPTSYYAITKRVDKAGYEYYWGAVGNHALLQDGATDKLYLHAGSDFVSNAIYTNDTFELFRIIYNGAASSAQINNGTVYTGNAGTTNLSSTYFALLRQGAGTYYKSFVITPMLSTAKDLALKNIINTIYPTY